MPLQKLAIYYGYPSLVNDSRGDPGKAAKIFSQFSHVILGGRLENEGEILQPKHPDHDPTKKIIQAAAGTEFFGYVNLGVTNTPEPCAIGEIGGRVRAWKEMGVAGIFLDAAGFEYGVTRERQNASVKMTHELSLKAFVNSHHPEDAFSDKRVPLNALGGGNLEGLKAAVEPGDLYLFESFVISGGLYQDPAFTREKLLTLFPFKRAFRLRTFGVATFNSIGQTTEDHFKHLFYCAILADFDGVCIADPAYAATTNRLHLFTPSLHREV